VTPGKGLRKKEEEKKKAKKKGHNVYIIHDEKSVLKMPIPLQKRTISFKKKTGRKKKIFKGKKY